MAVAHDRARRGLGAVAVAAVVDRRHVAVVGVVRAVVVAQLVREHHDVPIPVVMTLERIRERAVQVAGDRVAPLQAAHGADVRHASAQRPAADKVRGLAGDLSLGSAPEVAELRQRPAQSRGDVGIVVLRVGSEVADLETSADVGEEDLARCPGEDRRVLRGGVVLPPKSWLNS